MNQLKKVKFWMPGIYTIIVILNLIGLDDKNILLFFTSPPFWITETSWFVKSFTHPSKIPLVLIFIVTFLFWYLLGSLIDYLIDKIKA